jgi:hypothetical protein
MAMVRIVRGRVLRGLKPRAVRAKKGSEVVIESMIFLNDNYHMIDSVGQFGHGFSTLVCFSVGIGRQLEDFAGGITSGPSFAQSG